MIPCHPSKTAEKKQRDEKLFNLEHLKGKFEDFANEVEKFGRTNMRNGGFEDGESNDARTAANSARSHTVTKSSVTSSGVKNRSNFRVMATKNNFMKAIDTNQRGISEEVITKMKEVCDDNVRKMYLSKFRKDFKVRKATEAHPNSINAQRFTYIYIASEDPSFAPDPIPGLSLH